MADDALRRPSSWAYPVYPRLNATTPRPADPTPPRLATPRYWLRKYAVVGLNSAS